MFWWVGSCIVLVFGLEYLMLDKVDTINKVDKLDMVDKMDMMDKIEKIDKIDKMDKIHKMDIDILVWKCFLRK